ncbi:hypothetical protein ACFS4T_12835 [Pseudomonas lini]
MRDQLAYFPAGSNKLVDLPFEYITQTMDDGLLLVERETNGPYGLYDSRNHRFTLPMKFVNPTVSGNLFIARLGTKTYATEGHYGAYTLAGKEVLPPQFFRDRAKRWLPLYPLSRSESSGRFSTWKVNGSTSRVTT